MDLYKNTHIYLTEDYFSNPKKMFFEIVDLIQEYRPDIQSFLDVGCARGELNYVIQKSFPRVSANAGIDLCSDLIDSGTEFFRKTGVGVQLHNSGCEDFNLNRSFDVISMLGLLPALNEIDETLRNARRHQARGDILLITTKFNHYDTKTVVRYKTPKLDYSWQTTVTHALTDVEKSLAESGYQVEGLRKFDLGLILERSHDDPSRAHTLHTELGVMHLTGYGQLFDIETIVAKAI